MLSLHRMALLIRRTHPDLVTGDFSWIDTAPGILAFRRGTRFACVVNLTDTPVELPSSDHVWLASSPLEAGRLLPDAAVWLRPTT
jgi:alpha-glucosidase